MLWYSGKRYRVIIALLFFFFFFFFFLVGGGSGIIIIIIFYQKTGFDISCKCLHWRPLVETICMKCQNLLSAEKNITNLSSAELAQGLVNVRILSFELKEIRRYTGKVAFTEQSTYKAPKCWMASKIAPQKRYIIENRTNKQAESAAYPASILYKSTAGRYRPVSYPDGPITARYRFIKNAYWVNTAFEYSQCESELKPGLTGD